MNHFFSHGSCNNFKGMPGSRAYLKGVSHLFNPFVHFFCVAQKKWTKEKGAAARSLSLRFSHRFQRIAKAQLILYQPSADDLGAIAVNSYMLCKWPLLVLYTRMARIQCGQEVYTRWTVRSHSWLLSRVFLAPALPDAAVARCESLFSKHPVCV